MNDDFEKRLVQLAKEVLEYRKVTDSKDYTFLSKLDYLLGYIMALEVEPEEQ